MVHIPIFYYMGKVGLEHTKVWRGFVTKTRVLIRELATPVDA